MSEFHQKNVLILGCAKGIGKVIAERFADDGAHLILVDIDPDLPRFAARLRQAQKSAESHALDFNDTASVRSALPQMIGDRKIAGCVYVTGCRSKKGFEDFAPSDWELVMNTALKNVFFSAQALRDKFEKENSFFIAISSVAAQFVGAECVGYHCAKAGLEQLTRYLASALGSRGVRVNAVRPGMIVKDEHRERFGSEANSKYRELSENVHPLRAVGDSLDVAELVLFLASRRTKFVTGQVWSVDGGLTIQDPFDVAYRFGGR